MLRLVENHSISAAEVEHIEADLKPYPLVRQTPTRGFEGRFSMPFCLSHVLVHHRLEPTDFSDQRLNEPMIQHVIHRVEHLPDSPQLTVVLRNGDRLTEAVQPPSDLKGWERTAQKFTASAQMRLSIKQIETVTDAVKRLSEITSTKTLTGALKTDHSSR
jgi:2-methylcitrate dehydratase PrpD